VTCGIHDSNASLIPHLETREAPFTIVSSGTWAIAMTVGGPTTALDAARDSLANVDAHGRPVPTARFMGGREFDLLVPAPVDPSAADIARVIAQGFQALPSFVPGVGPFPHARGRWTCDPDALTPGERTAVVTLYLALMTEACLEICGLGREIIVEGALARNQLFGDALARLTGVPVASSRDATGTSLGASLLFGSDHAPKNTALCNVALKIDGFDAYRNTWRLRL
jgi:sugar (pentulose or hexulose) kinase